MSELGKLKELPVSDPQLQAWKAKHYPAEPDLPAALKEHRKAMDAAAGSLRGEMNRVSGLPLDVFDLKWAEVAKDPKRLEAVLSALRLLAQRSGD